MEGHHRPAHPLTQWADAPPPLCGSAGDDDHIPAADRQPVAHLDLRALLQSDRRGGGFIDGAVGAHHHRSDHHIARHRAVDGDLVGGVVEQIRHLLAAGVRSAAHRHLSGERGAGIGDARVFHGFTQDGADVMPESESKPEAYICNLTPGTVVGFKYLNFQNVTKVSVKTRGMCYYGGFDVLLTADGEPIGTVSAARGNEWTWQTTELAIPDGISAIYFRMKGYGTLSLAAVKFH